MSCLLDDAVITSNRSTSQGTKQPRRFLRDTVSETRVFSYESDEARLLADPDHATDLHAVSPEGACVAGEYDWDHWARSNGSRTNHETLAGDLWL